MLQQTEQIKKIAKIKTNFNIIFGKHFELIPADGESKT